MKVTQPRSCIRITIFIHGQNIPEGKEVVVAMADRTVTIPLFAKLSRSPNAQHSFIQYFKKIIFPLFFFYTTQNRLYCVNRKPLIPKVIFGINYKKQNKLLILILGFHPRSPKWTLKLFSEDDV